MTEHTNASTDVGVCDAFMTTQELADHWRTSPETVRYWQHVGYGPHGVKVGRRVLYARRDVSAWLEALRAEGER